MNNKWKNKVISKYLLLVVILLFFVIIGLFWLPLFIVVVLLLYLAGNYLLSLLKNGFLQKMGSAMLSFSIIVVVAISIRVFVFDIFLIPSSSMENTLYAGDVVVVNKLKYGPNLPQSPYEIPLVNIFYFLKDNSKEAIQHKTWKPRRLSGTSAIKQGDVVVFKKEDKSEFLVKRCVALPGDSFKIVDSKVYTNNNLFEIPENVKATYIFKFKNKTESHKVLSSFNIVSISKDGNWKLASLSSLELAALKSLNCTDSLQQLITSKPIKARMFPWYKDKKWTLDNYGTVIIPKKGMKIQLTKDTYDLYKFIIKNEEDVEIKETNNLFWINGKTVSEYVFKKNYYFMMGDNRYNSCDSRYIGFISEEKIIGKVSCVLFSYKNDGFQWNRLFKQI